MGREVTKFIKGNGYVKIRWNGGYDFRPSEFRFIQIQFRVNQNLV